MDKLLAVSVRTGRIKGRAQDLDLRLTDGAFDDEVAPLAEESHVFGDFRRQLGIEVLGVGAVASCFSQYSCVHCGHRITKYILRGRPFVNEINGVVWLTLRWP